jgi:hypothetical protein
VVARSISTSLKHNITGVVESTGECFVQRLGKLQQTNSFGNQRRLSRIDVCNLASTYALQPAGSPASGDNSPSGLFISKDYWLSLATQNISKKLKSFAGIHQAKLFCL